MPNTETEAEKVAAGLPTEQLPCPELGKVLSVAESQEFAIGKDGEWVVQGKDLLRR